ncbi:site-2 protease family protein [Anaeromassilibacillus senegalensis]|uniref:Site-2 protease family protein n=2 Tax=Anaeromassilibacillus senegalensis TaxID=1673717 RepID=A0ABS9CMJ5_9FIRM|nr:site-2 protease family protein [Anaeromassilibacillus senegalensis]
MYLGVIYVLFNSIMTLLRGGNVDPLDILMQVLATLVIVLLALPLHEFAHGWVANKLGDPTARLAGRLTFNPLASVDPMGAGFLLLFGIGWARPVPVDSRYFKNPRSGMALTALAGPASNLIASFVGALLFYAVIAFAPYNVVVHYILLFISYFAYINAVLAVFNLVPIPPLDGSKILASFLSDRARFIFYQYQNILAMVGMILIVSGALTGPLSMIESAVYGGVSWLASLPFRLFGVL